MNRCNYCKKLFAGHVACPHCGENGYHDLDGFAGLVIRGDTFKHREQIKAAGAKWDAGRKEWVLPNGITSEQYDALTLVLNNSELQKGWYENPADYESGPIPGLAQQ